jgi:hypothetical protein
MSLFTMFSKNNKSDETKEVKAKNQKYSTVSGYYHYLGIQVFHMKSPIGDAHKGYTAIVNKRWVYGNTRAEVEAEIRRTLKEYPMVGLV